MIHPFAAFSISFDFSSLVLADCDLVKSQRRNNADGHIANMHGPMVTDPTQICYTDVHQVHHSFTPMPCIVVLVCSHYSIRFVFMGFWTLTMMVYSQFES